VLLRKDQILLLALLLSQQVAGLVPTALLAAVVVAAVAAQAHSRRGELELLGKAMMVPQAMLPNFFTAVAVAVRVLQVRHPITGWALQVQLLERLLLMLLAAMEVLMERVALRTREGVVTDTFSALAVLAVPALWSSNGGSNNGALCRTGRQQHGATRHCGWQRHDP
jgi:hypothetical protein